MVILKWQMEQNRGRIDQGRYRETREFDETKKKLYKPPMCKGLALAMIYNLKYLSTGSTNILAVYLAIIGFLALIFLLKHLCAQSPKPRFVTKIR